MNGYFAGTGPRLTQKNVLRAASKHIVQTYTLRLRSSHRLRSEIDCEIGANGFADIYLPWEGYGSPKCGHDYIFHPNFYRVPPVLGIRYIPKNKDSYREKLAKTMCELTGRVSYDKLAQHFKDSFYSNTCQLIGHTFPIIQSKLVLCYMANSYILSDVNYIVALAEHLNIPIVNVINKTLDTVLIEIDNIMKIQNG